MVKTAIMQPYIFPYFGYFQLLNAVDKFIILDDVNYIKKGWINRNRILVNGEASLFTIPLEKPSQNKLINETFLSQEYRNWQSKFLKSLEFSYRKAPRFSEVIELMKSMLAVNCSSLSNLLKNSISKTADFLGVKTEIIKTSTGYAKDNLKGENRIIDICQQENCTHYINPIGGQELYSKKNFSENGMKMSFLQSDLFIYDQLNNNFVSGLSIIDVLMFNDKYTIKKNFSKYKLV